MQTFSGGCLCGAIRYHGVAEPIVSRICWCRDCQHIAGNGTVNVIVPSASIVVEGDPGEYVSVAASGNQVRRRFCRTCGCHLFADNSGRPGLMVIRVGTLDDPSSVSPTANIWSASAPAWACLDSALPSHAQQPQQR